MFGSVLEVAIGVVFVFLLASIICSAVREGIEAFLKTRAAFLERGIRELLHDREATGLAKQVYTHPLVSRDVSRSVCNRAITRSIGGRSRVGAIFRRTSRRGTSRWRCSTSPRAARSTTAIARAARRRPRCRSRP